jgi:membrane-associated phospholipid phosphatase
VDHAEVSSPPPHEGREADRVLQEDPEQRFVGARDLTHWPTAPGAALARAALRLRERLAPHSMLLVILLVGFAVVAVLTVLAGLVYDSVSEKDGVAGLDRPALSAAMAVRTPLGNTLARAYTDIGGTTGMPILATLVAVGLALTWRQWTPVLLVAATAIGSITLTVVGKAVVGRIRPPLADAVPPYEHSASFPSGHALNSIALAGIVAYLLVRRQHGRLARLLTATAAAAFAITMGMSRVYLGHHWFTDVLVAWALGLAWLTAVITAHRLLLTVRARDRPGAVQNEPLDREPDGGHTPS